MTWAGTMDDIQTALAGLSDGAYKAIGEDLLAQFNEGLVRFKDVNGGSSAQPSHTTEFITWRDVTFPNFLAEMRELADTYDGKGTSVTESNPYKEWRVLRDRLKQAADGQSDDVRNLLNQAVDTRTPTQPREYEYSSFQRKLEWARAVQFIESLDAKSQLWLALVA